MWRWTSRVYVSFMLFWVLVFGTVVSLRVLAHLLTQASFPGASVWFASHVFLTALLAGWLAGQVPVDSRLTGEGWFRSKDGKTFEGLKLVQLRPWTWLMVTPIVILGITALFLKESRSVFSSTTLSSFLGDLISKNCSSVWAQKNWFDTSCNVQLVLLAPWVASIGYSIAPWVQKHGPQVLWALRSSRGADNAQEESRSNLKKADL